MGKTKVKLFIGGYSITHLPHGKLIFREFKTVHPDEDKNAVEIFGIRQ